MREIRLYGELGKRFGRVHRFAVANAAEAIRALRANFPDFERAILDVAPAYRVFVGSQRLADAGELHAPSGDRETIRIAPALSGAKQGIGQVIIGAVLIAAAVVGNIFFPGNPISPYLLNAGVAMVIGGVAQMLSPPPKANDPNERPENKPSYVFSGAVNTTAQGHPVPVGYGRMIIGSAVISGGLYTEDINT